jgi:hypothetical protein
MKRALLVLLLLAGAAFADDIPATQQSYLIIRILSYDRNVHDRSGGSAVNVAVVYKPGNSASEATQQAVVQAIQSAAESANVSGLPITVEPIPYDGSLESRASGAHAAAIYVCPGLEDALPAIQSITHKNRILSFTNIEPNVKNGLSVGLFTRGGRPTILVNLPATQAEGANLDSALLRVAEVLK